MGQFFLAQLDLSIPEQAQARRALAHLGLWPAELRERVAKTALWAGMKSSRERHVSRGKLLPRDRVERLLDPGSPFLEIGQLAANGMYGDEVPGAGIIAGDGPRFGLPVHDLCQ